MSSSYIFDYDYDYCDVHNCREEQSNPFPFCTSECLHSLHVNYDVFELTLFENAENMNKCISTYILIFRLK